MSNPLLRTISLSIFLVVTIMLTFCEKKQKEENILSEADQKLKIDGERLSKQHCTACHMYSGPEDLDKTSWARVLSLMDTEMKKISYTIEKKDWITIQQYYRTFAPYNLTFEEEVLLQPVKIFARNPVFDSIPGANPFVSLIEYDTTSKLLYTADMYKNLYVFNKNKLVKTYKTNTGVVDMEYNSGKNAIDILEIGSFVPSEVQTGQLVQIDQEGNQKVLIDSMKRAVHFSRYDFNKDGEEEYLISCFGSTVGEVNSGNLSLYSLEDSVYKEKFVKNMPGATMSKLVDWNNDGLMDFMALFSQARESIILFINKGNFQFEEKVLLNFSPVWGSLYFDLADMNEDGFPDIVYVNGDNGDQSPIYKNYHGVRIYVNDGKDNFKEEYFFFINGASKAIIRDFDGDGDNDMATVAMYSNTFSRAQESLVYLENKGDLDFDYYYIEAEPSGKWMLMDAYDYDNDGDDDLIVGSNIYLNFPTPELYKKKWRESSIPYVIFENTSSRDKGFWEAVKEMF